MFSEEDSLAVAAQVDSDVRSERHNHRNKSELLQICLRINQMLLYGQGLIPLPSQMQSERISDAVLCLGVQGPSRTLYV